MMRAREVAGSMGKNEDPPGITDKETPASAPKLHASPSGHAKGSVRHLEIESRANPWKGLMLPLHQWRATRTRSTECRTITYIQFMISNNINAKISRRGEALSTSKPPSFFKHPDHPHSTRPIRMYHALSNLQARPPPETQTTHSCQPLVLRPPTPPQDRIGIR